MQKYTPPYGQSETTQSGSYFQPTRFLQIVLKKQKLQFKYIKHTKFKLPRFCFFRGIIIIVRPLNMRHIFSKKECFFFRGIIICFFFFVTVEFLNYAFHLHFCLLTLLFFFKKLFRNTMILRITCLWTFFWCLVGASSTYDVNQWEFHVLGNQPQKIQPSTNAVIPIPLVSRRAIIQSTAVDQYVFILDDNRQLYQHVHELNSWQRIFPPVVQHTKTVEPAHLFEWKILQIFNRMDKQLCLVMMCTEKPQWLHVYGMTPEHGAQNTGSELVIDHWREWKLLGEYLDVFGPASQEWHFFTRRFFTLESRDVHLDDEHQKKHFIVITRNLFGFITTRRLVLDADTLLICSSEKQQQLAVDQLPSTFLNKLTVQLGKTPTILSTLEEFSDTHSKQIEQRWEKLATDFETKTRELEQFFIMQKASMKLKKTPKCKKLKHVLESILNNSLRDHAGNHNDDDYFVDQA